MEGNFNTMTIKNASLHQTITKVGNMKQKSHSWAQLPVLLLIVASAVVLLTVTALANSPSSTRSKADGVMVQQVATVPTAAPPGSHIYISTSHSGHIDINPGDDDDDDDVAAASTSDDDEVKFKSNDILSCTINLDYSCTWSVYLKGSDIGISGANLRDFEVLANGDIIFAIDRKKTLTVDGASKQVNARDVLRYQASDGTLHSVLFGVTIGLTKSSEDIDSVAWTPDGHLVIGTRGTAKYSNDLKARDRDLVKIVGGVPTLYFVGDSVGLTKSSEDINAAWIANPSENVYLVTKGSFKVHNGGTELKGKKSDILGCAPLTHDPINSCFFFSFFKGKPQDLDKQVDGLSIDASEPVASSAVAAALHGFASSVVDDGDDVSFDAEAFNEAVSENDPDISAEDFVDVRTQMYLPMVANH